MLNLFLYVWTKYFHCSVDFKPVKVFLTSISKFNALRIDYTIDIFFVNFGKRKGVNYNWLLSYLKVITKIVAANKLLKSRKMIGILF
jgi:hypothetical protein